MKRFVFFTLSYFDYSKLQFGWEIGWSTVRANGKQNEAKPPIEIGLYDLLGSLSVVVLVKDPSLPCVVQLWPVPGVQIVERERRCLKLRTRSSMTGECLSGLAMMLIHRGINYMPTPKDICERK